MFFYENPTNYDLYVVEAVTDCTNHKIADLSFVSSLIVFNGSWREVGSIVSEFGFNYETVCSTEKCLGGIVAFDINHKPTFMLFPHVDGRKRKMVFYK